MYARGDGASPANCVDCRINNFAAMALNCGKIEGTDICPTAEMPKARYNRAVDTVMNRELICCKPASENHLLLTSSLHHGVNGNNLQIKS